MFRDLNRHISKIARSASGKQKTMFLFSRMLLVSTALIILLQNYSGQISKIGNEKLTAQVYQYTPGYSPSSGGDLPSTSATPYYKYIPVNVKNDTGTSIPEPASATENNRKNVGKAGATKNKLGKSPPFLPIIIRAMMGHDYF